MLFSQKSIKICAFVENILVFFEKRHEKFRNMPYFCDEI